MKDKFLFLIPARSGSKGIPHKNIKNFCGKPLMAWTIEEAKKSKYCHALILSSDSEKYLEVGRKYGCEYTIKRPESLSTDSASSRVVIEHAIEEFPGYDYIVLLQPTSPLRTVEDIDGAIELMLKKNENSCVSVNEAKESPYWMYEINNNRLKKMLNESIINYQRQKLPKAYILNGALFICKIENFIKQKSLINSETVGFVMTQNRSFDIDSEEDWQIAEMFFNKRDR